jgi:hypothetical protein
VALLASLGLVALLGMAKQRQSDPKQSPCCRIADDALKNWQDLKVGMTRRDVEKSFILDGGMQFPSSSTYVIPNCEYIKVKIQFKHLTPNTDLLSPNDTVTKISKLFVTYPTRD